MKEKTIKIVVVEDDEDIRNYIVSILNENKLFHLTHSLIDAESAMKVITDREADVVIVDINLPGKSGIDLVYHIKPLFPNIQFIMYTSLFDADTIFDALKAGATGYLTKETPPEKLSLAILDAHQGGSPISSDIARKIVKSFHEFEKKKDREKLSNRENEIIYMLAEGLRYKEIADKLFISTETVRTHVRNIYEKLQVNSRTEALNKYF